MFGKMKKDKLPLKIEIFTLQWYPSNRNCARSARRKGKLQRMPPLMVRKPEWRR
jgi:hypothetical protein